MIDSITETKADQPTPKDWLRGNARLVRGLLLAGIGLGAAAGVLLIVQAGLLAFVVHQVLFEASGLENVFGALMALPVLMLVRAGLVWGGEQFGVRAAMRVKSLLRMRVMDHLAALGPERLRGRSSGDLAHHVVDGIEGLEAYFSRYLPQAALAALLPLAVLAFVFPMDFVSGLILLFTAPFIPLFMFLIGSRAEKLNQRQWRRLAMLSARFLDSLQGLTTLRLFNATRREARIIAEITDDYRESTLSVLRIAFLSALVLEFFSTVSLAVVAVIIGFKLLSGSMAFQAGFFILLLAPEFYLPLRTLGVHYHSRLSAMAASEGLTALLAERPRPSGSASGVCPEWSTVELDIKNLDFSHAPDQPVLRGFSLHVPSGSRLALIGPSGVGKTSLLRLLLGTARPEGGRILVNGTDLTGMDLEHWLRHVAWMPQNPYIAPTTMWENVLLGGASGPSGQPGRVDTVDWDALDKIAALIGLNRDLAAMDQGWQTRVGEGGAGLSGGQCQRLTLARVLARTLGKPVPLLLLDEPTAHLDDQGAEMVLAALGKVSDGVSGKRTVVIASHDPRVREFADVVVELTRPKDACPPETCRDGG
ncbi:thiol reductant ABC exporter subunit CydD [Desulfonatronum sp. SC1]|uniref:thiol reductant ABC exporter subunit CydD n=1 Tax=Desulfonatronum sp. SC1 TaxID=2109626 RepID=UPI000D30E692|nr:thiol reductant ABC exporter subunit CydD [Desulfonatronum sp. SC1]PTN36981.1 thiol reductant ABC exporter subunit CydD [Desulfonatronum sp. SC1]